MKVEPNISFEDTAVAFSYKSDAALRKAHFIFSLVNNPIMSSIAIRFTKLALAIRLPILWLIKKTAFEHFCGGEGIETSESVIDMLARYNVGTILDYSVEGEKSENGFDNAMNEILLTIEKAHHSDSIPFSVFKVTGLASFSLLEKLHKKEILTSEEERAFERVRARIDTICAKAHAYNIRVLIDAEESWIQGAIDSLAYRMMAKYNKEKAVVYNTFQLYKVDSFLSLREAYHMSVMHSYFLGAKLVRGAYMEKERARALALGYKSPIHLNKEATDGAFNQALLFCLDNKQRISFMCGSHNEYSNYFLTVMMEKHGLKKNDERVWFSQLYGMSDNISFNLAKAGYRVAKYVPYGPVESVMPYLFRRAAENTSVAGQSSRELMLIRKELGRRKNATKSVAHITVRPENL